MNIKFSDLDTMIVFAKNSKGDLVFVDDVQNGYSCNCFCMNCGGRLNAKNNGVIKAHHFAHSGQGCDETNAYMMGLYMLIKEGADIKLIIALGYILM